MRRYESGTFAAIHSLSCAFCEEEDWGYKLITGRTPEAVTFPPQGVLDGVCPACFEAMPEDWDNADQDVALGRTGLPVDQKQEDMP